MCWKTFARIAWGKELRPQEVLCRERQGRGTCGTLPPDFGLSGRAAVGVQGQGNG